MATKSSPSGTGVKVQIRIPDDCAHNPGKFTACFETFVRYVAENYPGITVHVDPVAKGIEQLCFYMWDPKAKYFVDAYVLQPDDDLLAKYEKTKKVAAKPQAKPIARPGEAVPAKARVHPDAQPTPPGNLTDLMLERHSSKFESMEKKPMEGWDAARQWEAVKGATDALMDNLANVPDGQGERNKFWTHLGYAYSDWLGQIDDASIEDEARGYLIGLAEANYGRGEQPVQNALDNGNGNVSLGTLFHFARAYANWVPPWIKKGNKGPLPAIMQEIGLGSTNGEATFIIHTWEDIANASSEPPPAVIAGVLPEKGLMTRAGRAKGLKTWDALGLCLAIGTGTTWHDREVKQGPVVYYNLELSPEQLLYRVKLLARLMGIKDYRELEGVFVPLTINPGAVWHKVREDGGENQIKGMYTAMMINEMVRAAEQAKVQPIFSCVDSFYKLNGDLDENSAGDVTTAYAYLRKLGKETSSAIDLIHHFAKGSPGDKMSGERSADREFTVRNPTPIASSARSRKRTAYRSTSTCGPTPASSITDAGLSFPGSSGTTAWTRPT